MQDPESMVVEVDRHLQIMVRLWRWDRIGGRKTACRRDLLELDQLLDQRLARKPATAGVTNRLRPVAASTTARQRADCRGSRHPRPASPDHPGGSALEPEAKSELH
jgi:hypothetical protein